MRVLLHHELEKRLTTARSRLVDAFGPCAIYLFGSYAAATAGEHSDIDLCVVVPASALDFHQRCVQARRALAGFGHPLDVLVYTEAEFEERAAWSQSLERAVKQTGRLLHAA